MVSIWSVATAWNLYELAINKAMLSFAQQYVAVRYSNNFIIDCLVQPFVEGMTALVQLSVDSGSDKLRELNEVIQPAEVEQQAPYPAGIEQPNLQARNNNSYSVVGGTLVGESPSE